MQIEQTRLEQLMPLIKEALSEGKNVRFFPYGFSMLPMLRQGLDSVVISPLAGKLKIYDLPLYQRDNGQYVLHRIVRIGDSYTCIGDNQFIKETDLRYEQFIGVVTAFYRNDRRVSVHNFTYQLYCRFWHYTRFIRRVWRKIINFIKHSKI